MSTRVLFFNKETQLLAMHHKDVVYAVVRPGHVPCGTPQAADALGLPQEDAVPAPKCSNQPWCLLGCP